MDQYIGSKQIVFVKELEDKKTPGGDIMVEVSFNDDSKDVMPKKKFELVSKDQKYDDIEINKIVTGRVASIIFGMLHEYDLTWGQVNPVIEAIGALMENGMEKAYNIHFGVDTKTDIPLNKINQMLKEHNESGK